MLDKATAFEQPLRSSDHHENNIGISHRRSDIVSGLPPLHHNSCTKGPWKEVTDLSVDSTATDTSSHTTQGENHHLEVLGGERGMENVGQGTQQSDNVEEIHQEVSTVNRVSLSGREGVLRRLSEVLIRGSLTLVRILVCKKF